MRWASEASRSPAGSPFGYHSGADQPPVATTICPAIAAQGTLGAWSRSSGSSAAGSSSTARAATTAGSCPAPANRCASARSTPCRSAARRRSPGARSSRRPCSAWPSGAASGMAPGVAYELLRVRTRDRDETTVYLVRHPARATRVSVVRFDPPARLDHWCAATRRPPAVIGRFFVRDPFRPLGEVWIDGAVVPHEPVAQPWAGARACVHAADVVRLQRRDALPDRPPGHLVQSGPLLVRDGRSVVDGTDPEGFSAGSAQFDSD